MKNAAIIAIAILAMWYFVKEGEKVTESESDQSIADKLKAGLRVSLKNFLNIVDKTGNEEVKPWQPAYVGELPPSHMMTNENDPAFSAFTHVLTPRRGSFIRHEYRPN